MGADDVLEALYPLLLRHGRPEHIRSDNGPEFVAQVMQDWLAGSQAYPDLSRVTLGERIQ